MLRAHGVAAPAMLVALATLAASPAVARMSGSPGSSRPTVRVAVVHDGPRATGPAATRSREALRRLEAAAIELTQREFDLRFPDELDRTGDWSLERVSAIVDELLADPGVDLLITFGPIGTIHVCRMEALPKPVIAAYAIDVQAQRLPAVSDDEGHLVSGRTNLSYVTETGSAFRDLQVFHELVGFERVHVLVDRVLLETNGEIATIAAFVAERLGVEVELLPVGQDAASALAQLPDDAETVYVTPLNRFSEDEFARLADGLIERGLPSFSLIGRDEVELGLLAGNRPATNYERMARRIALDIQRILLGEDAGTLPVRLEAQEQLTINVATMRALDLPMSWRTLVEADLVDDERQVEEALTLDQAVQEALARNPSLRAKREQVAAGAEDVTQARSIYRPALDVSASAVAIDDRRAQASFGSNAERSVDGALSVEQLLFSEGVNAEVNVTRNRQRSLERELDALRLDVALDTATAFLDVLRAETLERIERENLQLTRSNLELARRRQEVGYSGPADVFRWESALANSRSSVIAAVQLVRAQRFRLNRLMNRPQRQELAAVPPRLEDPRLLTGFGRLAPYLETVTSGELFMEFLVHEGVARSPEIAALDASIAAQERVWLATGRSFWAPRIFAAGDYRKVLDRSGAGSEPPVGFPDLDESWSLGLYASLPLYAGGERASRRRQAADVLRRLRAEREALVQTVALGVRQAYTSTGSSYAAIGFAREAATASARNLELVTDSYSQGVVSVIELLDAQSSALNADLSASNAVYDFLRDLMALQRAAASFGFLSSAEEREAWFDRLAAWFAESGAKPLWPSEVP